MAKKKVTRKQLLKEPDEFITFTGKAIRFAARYRTQLISAVVAFFIGILIISGFKYFSLKAENRAAVLVAKNISTYETLSKDQDPLRAYAEVAPDFERILDKYSRTAAGKIANFTFANICYSADKPDKAISRYQKALDDFEGDPAIQRLILIGLGYAYEKKKAYETASHYFEKIVDAPDSFLKDEALFQAGRLYDEIGDSEKSAAAFKALLSDHPASMYIDLVREKIHG